MNPEESKHYVVYSVYQSNLVNSNISIKTIYQSCINYPRHYLYTFKKEVL